MTPSPPVPDRFPREGPGGDTEFTVRPLQHEDRSRVCTLVTGRWGDVTMVSRGRVHRLDELPGLIAERTRDRACLGLLTFRVIPGVFEPSALPGGGAARSAQEAIVTQGRYKSSNGTCVEIVSLESFQEGRGVGSALLAAVEAQNRKEGAKRLWLVTSNDNLRALRFYQKRGGGLQVCIREPSTRHGASSRSFP